MSKLIKFFMAMAIMLIALPFGSGVVKADDGGTPDLIKPDIVSKINIESPSLERYFGESAIVLEKDGQNYIQIDGNSGQYISLLSANGTDVVWGEIESDGSFSFQFKVDSLSDVVLFNMIIDPGVMLPMSHNNIELRFDVASKVVKTEEEISESNYNIYQNSINNPFIKKKIELNTNTPVQSGETFIIENDLGSQLTMPSNLPINAELNIELVAGNEIDSGNLEVAGQVYDFHFTNIDNYNGEFELVMTYDKDKYDDNQVDIYHFNESEGKWEEQEGVAKNGRISVKVDHFSKYGVFAKPKDEEDNNKKSPDDANKTDLLKPEKAFEIDYKILKEDGIGDSAANQYFTGKGLLFENKGNKYVHLTITEGDMVKYLKNKYGDALIVEENSDGSLVVQLRVNNDLSNMELDMHIVVPAGSIPGFPGYDREHKGLFLVFDQDSLNELDDIGDHMLVGTNNPDNKNGPFVEDGSSNELGKGDDEKGKTEEPTNSNPDKDLNPKTGDSNNIAFYVFLLVSSLISLGFLVRKRQVN